MTALEGLDLEVAPGEVLGVVGASGCGKSTLLELVAGLQEPDAGKVAVGGVYAGPQRRSACGFMPQRDLLLPWRDALGNAALALECEGVKPAAARRRAEPLFERFGLSDFARARPAALSGGMRQRVAFMRTLLPGRPVLLLDEPFAALDAITRAEMQAWLADALAAAPRTVILVTHDVEEAIFLADRVAVLSPRPGPGGGRARRRPPPPPGPPGGSDRSARGPPARARPRGPRMRRVLLAAGLIALLVAAWAWVASLDSVDDLTLASPGETLTALRDDRSLLLDNAWVTLYEVLLGLAIAIVAGVGAALAMHLSRALRDAAYPLLVASQAVPIVVLAPIFVLAFDYGIGPKLAIVALICFFPITVAALDGLRATDPEQLKLMRSFGASRAADAAQRWSCPPRSRASSAACGSPRPCR